MGAHAARVPPLLVRRQSGSRATWKLAHAAQAPTANRPMPPSVNTALTTFLNPSAGFNSQ